MSAPNSDVVLLASTGGVTTLTLNRPAQFNALSEEMLAALQAAIDGGRGGSGCALRGAGGVWPGVLRRA